MSSFGTLIATITLAILVFKIVRNCLWHSPLDDIPSVGIPVPFGFYFGAWNYIRNASKITQEGYRKYPGQAFKVALLNRWLVIVNGRKLIEDIRRAPEDQLSLHEAANSLFHLEHTLGHDQHYDPYHASVVRTTLTRNISACFSVIRSEVVDSFEDLIPPNSDEWQSMPAMKVVMQVVSRTSNRLFIGLRCRDPDYISITTRYSVDANRDSMLLILVPSFLRPIAMRLFGSLNTATQNAMKHLGPILEDRLLADAKHGMQWPESDRPNDMISWLLDETRYHPRRRTIENLTRTLLTLNLGAIHTTTQAFVHVLYNLAAYPQYVSPMREEIEAAVKSEGWSKSSMNKMVKLESFLKETARFYPHAAIGALRKVMQDFTFSDGTTVPAGSILAVPVLAEQRDESNYTHADNFDPFRFSQMHDGLKHQMVTTSPDFLIFGIGRQACPGRFFAVAIMKLMLAHVVMTYDVKFKDGVRPEDEWTAVLRSPNKSAEVMFRRRS